MARGTVGWLVVLTIGATPAETHAQSQSPGAFFDKGYAGSPNIGSGEMPVAPQRYTPIGKEESAQPLPQRAAEPSQNQGAPPSGEKPRYRMSVTLYVASHDKRHFEEVMRTAFKLTSKNQHVAMSEIYHIGDSRNVSAAIKDEAAARHIYMGPLVQPPSTLNIEASPAWVLRDGVTQGTHIVEGIMQIDRCIDAQGEYREPERSMFEAPATPTMGVKAF